jgi:hypothetical protein
MLKPAMPWTNGLVDVYATRRFPFNLPVPKAIESRWGFEPAVSPDSCLSRGYVITNVGG